MNFVSRGLPFFSFPGGRLPCLPARAPLGFDPDAPRRAATPTDAPPRPAPTSPRAENDRSYSDRVGRKPILVLSLLGVGAGLVSQAHCVAAGWSLKTFLALRVASGACAGASPVVKAYLADAASQEDLQQWMAWREASCTLAFIVGPTLGGLLFHGSSLHACIAVTGWASIAAAALVAVVMREAPRSATDDGGGGSSWKRTAADEETETVPVRPLLECDEDRVQCEEVIYTADELNSGGDDIGVYGGRSIRARAAAATQGKREAAAAPLCPLGRGLVAAVSTICLTSFMYNAGQSSFDSFFPVYASGTLGMGPREIGGTLTSLSAVSFGVSAFLFAKITKVRFFAMSVLVFTHPSVSTFDRSPFQPY